MVNDSDVITINSSDDDVIVTPPSSQGEQKRANKRRQNPAERDEEVIIVEKKPITSQWNPVSQDDDDEDEEGVPLERMRNTLILPIDWQKCDVLDKHVVILGGDDYCVQEGQKQGARSVTVFRTYESEGTIGNILALADAMKMDQKPEFPDMTDGISWPNWPHFESTSTEGTSSAGPIHVLLSGFKMNEGDKRKIEGIKTVEACWKEGKHGKWKLITGREKIIPCDLLITDEGFTALTANKYSLSYSMALVKEHSHR